MKRSINLNRIKKPEPRKHLNMSTGARERISRENYIPTLEDVKEAFAPPKTMGGANRNDSLRMAMDQALETNGIYSLIQHAADMGQLQSMGNSFMGYGALSSLTQNGLIRTCIESVADDMTREWINIKTTDTDGDGDDSDEHREIVDKIVDFDIQKIFHRAAELDGYFGGCLIFIDTGVRGNSLLNPLDISESSLEIKNLKRFTIVEPINCFIGQYESTDPLDPYYFRPKTWWILGQQVHASRVIHIAGNEVPMILKPAYNFFGLPQAQVLYDYVLHFQEGRVDVSRLLNKFSLTVMKTDLQDVLTNPCAQDTLNDRVNYLAAYRNNDGILAVDKESEDIMQVNTPLGGVTDIVRQQLEMICAVNRTPAVKTLGISPAGFNTGETDLQNYNDHINTMQNKVLRSGLQKVLEILQVICFGKISKSVTFDFNSLGEDDKDARSNRSFQMAQADATYLGLGVLSLEEVRNRMANDPDSSYNGIDADEIPEPKEDEQDAEYNPFNEAE